MKRNGFTLVELLIGSMIGAIVLMSVYVAFNAATKYWNKNNSATSAQQTARFASDHLSKNLKMANSTNKYYISTINLTNHWQYVAFKKSADTTWTAYIYYLNTGDTKARKIYVCTGIVTDPPYSLASTFSSAQPLTGDNVAGQNLVGVFPNPVLLPSDETKGIFSANGTDYAPASDISANELVYIDFIAQDTSALSTSQTAKGAQQIEIRTAVTYPHL